MCSFSFTFRISFVSCPWGGGRWLTGLGSPCPARSVLCSQVWDHSGPAGRDHSGPAGPTSVLQQGHPRHRHSTVARENPLPAGATPLGFPWHSPGSHSGAVAEKRDGKEMSLHCPVWHCPWQCRVQGTLELTSCQSTEQVHEH